jgi:peptidoglycan-associated lipoprotein
MKTAREKKLFLIILISASIFLYGGCGKKVISPYPATTTENQQLEHGNINNDLNRGMGVITEEYTAIEEPLTTEVNFHDSLSGTMAMGTDQQSEEHKKKHGRSSVTMQAIYFDFDQTGIRADMVNRMEHNGSHLTSNTNLNLLIEGNTDNRGTNEYNLALGERRAQNAKKYLVELGVETHRIRTLSFGGERPLFTGMTEFNFAQNRRADFVLE